MATFPQVQTALHILEAPYLVGRMSYQTVREKHYISSSHLGLMRCLTPFRVRISTIASI